MRPLTFHLIPHTHWDREWYLTHAGFQARLVPAVGDLLALLERDPSARFLLDGQSIIAEDALDVRPEWRSRVSAAVARGQLEVGPWYILADEIVPSGESLVRNLLTGTHDALLLGARMNALYSPDAFGHPAVLPTLAAQFGISTTALWRGLGRLAGIDRDLYRWRGPDGAEVLLYHFPASGYEIGAELADDPVALPSRWPIVRNAVTGRAASSQIAVFVGADHHAPPLDLRPMLESLQRLEPGNRVRLSTLTEYFEEVRRDAPELPQLSGELRWSYGHTWTLQGTHATRSRLKRQHGAAELLLQRLAEPLVALAEFRGGDNLGALMRRSWRTLLQCQFHDTICGCCHDDVAREQATRLQSVTAAAHEISRAALGLLCGDDPDRARAEPAAVTPTLLLWNPVPRPVAGIAVAELTFFRRDILVGPPNGRTGRVGEGAFPFVLADDDGRVYPVQLLSRSTDSERIDAARHYPDQDEVDRVRIAFDAPPMAGFGALALVPTRSSATAPDSRLIARAGHLSNPQVAIDVSRDGRVQLVDRRSGAHYPDILQWCDEADDGDSYSPQTSAASPSARAQLVRQSIIATGPLVGALALDLRVPSQRGEITARMVLVLHADSPIVRLHFTIDNRACDHRLRLCLPIGAGGTALSGAAFGFECRALLDLGDALFPAERPPTTAPAQRYVSVGSGDRSLALLAPGFVEYEWTAAHELLITLLRSIGELSRSTLASRPGHAGWPVSTPDAQELGRHVVTLALVPISASERDDPARLEALWEAAYLPIQPRFLRQFNGHTAALAEVGAELEGAGLVATALKSPQSGSGIVVRCFNATAAAAAGCWTFRSAIASAQLIRADEEVIISLPIEHGHRVRFVAPPRGLVSLLVNR